MISKQKRCLAAAALLAWCPAASGQADVSLRAAKTDAGLKLAWPGRVTEPDGTVVRPYFELQRSLDLRSWQPIGSRVRLDAPAAGPELSTLVPAEQAMAFFRLLAVQPRSGPGLASEGEEVFGYAEAFQQELARIGQITPQEFAANYASDADYLPGISWDPTTGQYWDLLRLSAFGLNPEELAVFRRNGFVVSERLGSDCFADVFYRLWKGDLPVFVSTDAILQAWHRTFDMMLEEVEETILFNSVDRMLSGMAARVPAAWALAGEGELADSLRDADYFLTVARSLLNDRENPTHSALGQDERVSETLAAIAAEEIKQFTRGALSTSGRAKKQIPISISLKQIKFKSTRL